MRGRRMMDRDQLRAGGLSLLIHAAAVLALAIWIDVDRPDPPPQDSYLLLELGDPAEADVTVDAAADQAPAQPAPDPGVASDLPGRPAPGVPDPEAASGGEPADAPTPIGVDVPAAPAPAARPPPAASAAPAPSPRVAIAVPDIAVPEVDARPLPDALPIPPVSADPSAGAIALPGASPGLDDAARRDVTSVQPDVGNADARSIVSPRPIAAASEGGRDLAVPEVGLVAPADAREVEAATPRSVRSTRRLPTPAVQAAVRPIAVDDELGAAASVENDAGPVGGDAVSPGQVGGADDAPDVALGRATDATEPGDGGARSVAPSPLRETRPRPIAVILDNANGYPQAGLQHASWIAEMPVEGGLTRLMAFFDAGEPARVGPVRSARDYFVEVAGRADAVVVHDGGSPSAMIALSQGVAPSVNAYTSGDLFERVADRSAPYDLYSAGSSLRGAIQRMQIDANRLLTGFRPVDPAADASPAESVSLDWSGVYDSEFRYVAAQDRYRWVRNGEDAVTADGTAVQVEAVLIARIEARAIPGDPAGRLYVPVNGGPALLLWRGSVQEGRWSVDGGIRFEDAEGRRVSLEALTTWAAFVPGSVEVDLR